jgi:hypothetical protein
LNRKIKSQNSNSKEHALEKGVFFCVKKLGVEAYVLCVVTSMLFSRKFET